MLDIPASWQKVKDRIIEKKGLVVVLGLPNVGKSSFVYYLSKEAIKNSLKVGIVNSDLGQSEIGVPTTVSLSIPEGDFQSFEELSVFDWYFVGSTSPVGHLLPLLVGVKNLVDKAKSSGCELIILNTCGLILGKLGKVLKYYKLSLLRPEHIVFIRKENELESFLKIMQRFSLEFYIIPMSMMARERSWEERRAFREKKFCRYFLGGISIDLPSFLIYSINKYIDKDKVEILKNRLVGLFGEREEFLALGILEMVDFNNNILKIFTPFKEKEKIKRIELGDLYLSIKGEELKKIAPHL
ncbi:MAG: Clp1/GlmU family protein [Dictyoglomus sp.]|nr:Clp1/GlmU family protein [Dictyoglomus sp.]MCX7942290.1 Clp1/GlmU family protein [Dictyoglomaceae bacterium]MDW8187866.1 Clp1/GlmU family protein [Dictyoglomus sp.]